MPYTATRLKFTYRFHYLYIFRRADRGRIDSAFTTEEHDFSALGRIICPWARMRSFAFFAIRSIQMLTSGRASRLFFAVAWPAEGSRSRT